MNFAARESYMTGNKISQTFNSSEFQLVTLRKESCFEITWGAGGEGWRKIPHQ